MHVALPAAILEPVGYHPEVEQVLAGLNDDERQSALNDALADVSLGR
jgi:hypothetical protein